MSNNERRHDGENEAEQGGGSEQQFDWQVRGVAAGGDPSSPPAEPARLVRGEFAADVQVLSSGGTHLQTESGVTMNHAIKERETNGQTDLCIVFMVKMWFTERTENSLHGCYDVHLHKNSPGSQYCSY